MSPTLGERVAYVESEVGSAHHRINEAWDAIGGVRGAIGTLSTKVDDGNTAVTLLITNLEKAQIQREGQIRVEMKGLATRVGLICGAAAIIGASIASAIAVTVTKNHTSGGSPQGTRPPVTAQAQSK